MKHLFYGSQVIAISDQLALILGQTVHLFASNGRAVMLPIAGYMDQKEVTAEILVSPSIPVMITEPYLPDTRPPAKHDRDSILYVEGEHDALENELDED